jgi:hypothetical protein
MSRFYASIKGSRGEATRQGTPKSGIAGHVRGWDVGAAVEIRAIGEIDIVYIYATEGSNGGRVRESDLLARFDGERWILRGEVAP